MKKLLAVILFLSFIGLVNAKADAGDSIGEYCWQLGYPFDDVICLTVENTSPTTFALFGSMSSQAEGYVYPVAGTVINDGFVYRIQLQTAGIYNDMLVNFALGINLNPATLSGSWKAQLSNGYISYLGAIGDKDVEADPEEGRRGLFERGL